MPTEIQTVLGATSFNETAGRGLFEFANRYSHLPRSTRIVINSLAYTEIADGMGPPTAVAEFVDFQMKSTTGGATTSAHLGTGTQPAMINLVLEGAQVRLCGLLLYRDPGDKGLFWNILVDSIMKQQTATVMVDYTICPFPETDDRDSQR